jgi:septum formation topological specificity factor MinE
MNAKQEDIKDVIKRFIWIDNDNFRVITHDGNERIIKVLPDG